MWKSQKAQIKRKERRRCERLERESFLDFYSADEKRSFFDHHSADKYLDCDDDFIFEYDSAQLDM